MTARSPNAARNAEIVALAKAGLPPRAIRQRLGDRATLKAIYQVLHRARRGDRSVPCYPPVAPRPIVVPDHLLAALQREAIARGLPAPILASRLLSAILADGLVAAVLDEPEGSRP